VYIKSIYNLYAVIDTACYIKKNEENQIMV